jgi:hypothetical protein
MQIRISIIELLIKQAQHQGSIKQFHVIWSMITKCKSFDKVVCYYNVLSLAQDEEQKLLLNIKTKTCLIKNRCQCKDVCW